MAETVERQKSSGFRAKLGVGLVIIVLVVILLVGGLYISLASTKTNNLLQSGITPSPQVESGEALQQLRATEEADLTNYGWVDRNNGIVHIPIDRAMDLILQRGLPTRPTDQPPSP